MEGREGVWRRLLERMEGMWRMEEAVESGEEVEGGDGVEGVGLIIALGMRMSLVFIPDGQTSVYGRVFPVS